MTNPLIISGPSGCGKSYLVRQLTSQYNCRRVVPTTTRAIRPGEVNGKDYHFVNEAEYGEASKSSELFMSNNFFNAWYGIQRKEVDEPIASGIIPITEIYTPVVDQFIEEYQEAYRVFLLPESLTLLESRMKARGDKEESILFRLRGAEEELNYFHKHAYHKYDIVLQVTETNGSETLREIANEASITPLISQNERKH
jgi:guanylate kinase